MHENFLLQINILKELGFDLPKDAKILDFGCGSGGMVRTYRDAGYQHVYGYDVLDYWDPTLPRDHYLPDTKALKSHDNQFNYIFSDQVLEHVLDYPQAISQLHSLLKPGGIALHIFPNRRVFIEPHIKVPFASMIQNRWYLLFWSILGIRNEFQKGLSVLETWRLNREFCKNNVNYVPKREIRRLFSKQFGEVRFAESVYLNHSYGRISKLPAFFKRSSLLAWLLGQFHVNVLFLRK